MQVSSFMGQICSLIRYLTIMRVLICKIGLTIWTWMKKLTAFYNWLRLLKVTLITLLSLYKRIKICSLQCKTCLYNQLRTYCKTCIHRMLTMRRIWHAQIPKETIQIVSIRIQGLISKAKIKSLKNHNNQLTLT